MTGNTQDTIWWSVSLAVVFVASLTVAAIWLYRRFWPPNTISFTPDTIPCPELLPKMDDRPILLLYSSRNDQLVHRIQKMKAKLRRKYPNLVVPCNLIIFLFCIFKIYIHLD